MTATSMATNESMTCRDRLRSMSMMAAAIGRPSVPIPPTTLNSRSRGEGSWLAPEVMSESRPAAVLVANHAIKTTAPVTSTANTNLARSRGRRRFLG